MKKIFAILITVCLLILVASTCFAKEGKVDNYQDIIIDINGSMYDTTEDIESTLKGINKVTIISTLKEDIKDTKLRELLRDNDNYLIITKSEWYGDEIIYDYGYLFIFDK